MQGKKDGEPNSRVVEASQQSNPTSKSRHSHSKRERDTNASRQEAGNGDYTQKGWKLCFLGLQSLWPCMLVASKWGMKHAPCLLYNLGFISNGGCDLDLALQRSRWWNFIRVFLVGVFLLEKLKRVKARGSLACTRTTAHELVISYEIIGSISTHKFNSNTKNTRSPKVGTLIWPIPTFDFILLGISIGYLALWWFKPTSILS